jgi:hypothetical protein
MATGAQDEARLMRMARKYQETEQSKSLRWFPAVGDDIPTDQDVTREAQLRQASLDAEAAARRDAERRTEVPAFAKHAPVHADEHPGFGLPADELAAQRPTTFAAAAAETVETKKHLHKTFTSGLWLMLARIRAERRLQRMAEAQRMRQASAQAAKDAEKGKALSSAASRTSAKTAANVDEAGGLARTTYNLDIDNISLLTLPALPPQGSTDAAPGSGGSGGLAALLAEEKPTTADAEVLLEREMKVPFEFKQRHYTRFKFTEHHFATCDPEDAPPNFPAGTAEAVEADADATVPALSNFSQPLVTLERFPGFDFAFERTLPHEGIVVGHAPQPVSNGGFLDPQLPVDYGQAAPSAARPVDAVRCAAITNPLPAPLKKPDEADDVSDDEDEDDDVALPKPSSLTSIAANFLPAFPSAASASRGATPADAERGGASASGIGAERGEAMLAFEPRPINNTGREGVNRSAAAALAEAAETLHALSQHLPANHRINF